MNARHDDLDLHDLDDRAIYRQRVAIEYANMKIAALREEAGVPGYYPRRLAVAAIADRRLREMGVTLLFADQPPDP